MQYWVRRRLAALVVGGIVLLLTLCCTGCGSGTPVAGSAPSAASSLTKPSAGLAPTAAGPTAPTSGPTTRPTGVTVVQPTQTVVHSVVPVSGSGGAKQTSPKQVAWIPFGPADPGTPAEPARAYAMLQNRNCDEVISSVLTDSNFSGTDPQVKDLYLAAGHACLAAADNNESEWRDATRYLAAAHAPDDCFSSGVRRLVTALLAAHAATPATIPMVVTPKSGATSCPYALTGFTPSSGPTSGHYTITLQGEGFWFTEKVHFGTQNLEVDEDETGAYVLNIPAADKPGPVTVSVGSGPYLRTAPHPFTYTTAPASP